MISENALVLIVSFLCACLMVSISKIYRPAKDSG